MVQVQELCPACGCHIVGEGWASAGEVYCCEACATGNSDVCECGCCSPVTEMGDLEQYA